MWGSRLRDRSRSQSAVIGFVLVFGIVVLMMTILQVSAVPTWNQGEEFAHSQQVRDDLELLRDDISRTAATGRVTSRSVTLGLQYPRRPFLINPADPSGRIRTTEQGTIRIENVTASGEAGNYWNGDGRTFTTRHIVYRADYNEYDNAPTTVIEPGVLYDRYEGRQIPQTAQSLVNGRRITLVTVNGTLSESGVGSESVELSPLSAPQQVTSVEGSGPVRLSLPTRLDEQTWTDLLEDERVENGGNVRNVTVTDGQPYDIVTITLRGDRTYDLRLAEVGVGGQQADHGPEYITVESSPEIRVPSGASERVVFEVRDRYNNPVSGVTVNATADSGTVTHNATTDSDGHAAFRYTASESGTARIQATFGDDPGGLETANVTVETAAGPTGGGDDTGPEVTTIGTNRTTDSGQTIQQGVKFTLTANASDFRRGGTDIHAVEWWSNRTEPDGADDPYAMIPAAGTFDTVNETAEVTGLDTAGWTNGTHEISVRARDANGNWGPERTFNVTVESPGISILNTTTANSGNAVDVTVAARGVAPGAEIEIQALGTPQTVTEPVSPTQPQTIRIRAQNQAEGIRAILYDASGRELDRAESTLP